MKSTDGFKPNYRSGQVYAVIAVIAIGILLAVLILRLDINGATQETDAGHHDAAETSGHRHAALPPEQLKGPHGGKLFTRDGYGVEVVIFERDVEPHFRLYTYLGGKPVMPQSSEISIVLERLGRAAQTINFVVESDYLKGDAIVAEPHSFQVGIHARYAGKSYDFSYAQEEARVRMDEQQITNNAIEILTAAPARIQSTLKLAGEIRLNADRTVYIVPRLAGMVESVQANAGDSVRKGQVLAVLSSQALADQRSEWLAAQKRLALAQVTYAREKKLWEEKISAEQDYLQARQTMQEHEIALKNARQKLDVLAGDTVSGNLTRYEIRAPIDGVITEKQISVGQVVKEDSDIFVVADLTTVWAEMTVYAPDINTLKPGQQVTIRSAALNADDSGIIRYVGALVGTQSRTATARVVLDNEKGVWRPGVPVDIELVAEEVAVPLAVSVEGLQNLGSRPVVFARYGDVFEARPIKLGRSDARYVEVLDGLLPGERYAAGNSFLIKAELGKAGASHDH